MELIIALIIMLPSGLEVITDIPSMTICRQERDALREKNVMAECVKDTRMMLEIEVSRIEQMIDENKRRQEERK